MREKIDAIARRIRGDYERLSSRARALRSSDLVVKASRPPLSLTVCAVDGGLLSQRMHGADIMVVRSVGVRFAYEGSALASVSYHPRKSPDPDISVEDSLDEHESVVFRSLIRLKSELNCAIESLERFSPDAILLDGSLLPLPSDRPPEGSRLGGLYQEVLSLFALLQKAAGGRVLAGVIKDSRSRKLAAAHGFSCSDSVLCGFLLDEGERTAAMPYREENPNKDLSSIAGTVKVFYLKPSAHDLPLRIETTDPDIDKVASLIYSLSAISENFAYPAILVEADMCAALDGNEMESIESSLVSLSGMRPLRRNSRPFR